MYKLLYFLMIFPVLFCFHANVLPDLFDQVKAVEIYNNGELVNLSSDEFDKFENLFSDALENSRQTPAYGVSIHDLTIKEMKSGIWLRFKFEQTIYKSQMPFDELLMKIDKNSYGVNIIRGNNGRYEGRCYYLELENNFDNLYDFITTISIEKEDNVEVELESQEIQTVEIVNEDNNEPNKDSNDKENDSNKINGLGEGNIEENSENEEQKKIKKELLSHLT